MPRRNKSRTTSCLALCIYCSLLYSEILIAQWNHIYTFTHNAPVGQLTSTQVHFYSPSEGYAYKYIWYSPSSGGGTAVQKTIDYGSTWGSGYGSVYLTYNDVFFGAQSIQEDTTYVFIRNIYDRYHYTLDRGVNWTTIYGLGWGLSGFHLINGNKGFVTSVGGGDQIKEISPSGVQGRFSSLAINFEGSKIYFPSEHIGYVVAKDTSDKALLLQSTDSGMNWHIQYLDTLGNYTFHDTHFINDSIGFVFTHNFLLKTIDSGQSFYQVSVPLNQSIYDMVFFNDTLGYCISTSGVYSISTDQGENWILNANLNSSINSFQILAPGFGYVGNTNNELYRLEDSFVVEELDVDAKLLIYPNPSSGTFYVEFGEDDSTPNFELYNLQGKLLISASEFTNPLLIHDFPSGNYMVRVKGHSIYQIILKL